MILYFVNISTNIILQISDGIDLDSKRVTVKCVRMTQNQNLRQLFPGTTLTNFTWIQDGFKKKFLEILSCVTLHKTLNFTTADSFCWTTLLEYIGYSPWMWTFKGWNMLELRKVFRKWWYNNKLVHSSVLIWYKSINVSRLL